MKNITDIFWGNVKANRFEFSNSIAPNVYQIIQILILEIVNNASEIGIMKDDYAILPWDQYNSDPTLALRYHKNGDFEIYFEYYDEDSEDLKETVYILLMKK